MIILVLLSLTHAFFTFPSHFFASSPSSWLSSSWKKFSRDGLGGWSRNLKGGEDKVFELRLHTVALPSPFHDETLEGIVIIVVEEGVERTFDSIQIGELNTNVGHRMLTARSRIWIFGY